MEHVLNELRDKIKIICVFHNSADIDDRISNKEVYLPIFGGKSEYHGNDDGIMKMLGDDTGDNISKMNRHINEISVFYWVWKHYEEIGNPEYIGVNHYRRFINWNYGDLTPNTILAHRVNFNVSVYDQYKNGHCAEDFDKFNAHLKTVLTFDEWQEYKRFLQEKSFCNNNMFVMSKENFFEYMKYMDKCIEICKEMMETQEINLYEKDMYQRRVYSFILERITGFYIYMKGKNGTDVKYVERDCVNCD